MAVARGKTASKKKAGLSVDFTGIVAGQGGGKRIEEGSYELEVVSCEIQEGSDSGEPYLKWVYKVVNDCKSKGGQVFDNTSLQPQALWRLRGILDALGVETEDGEFELLPDDYVGLSLNGEVENEEYDGKDRARLVRFGDEVEVSDSDEEDEAPAPKAKAKAEPAPKAKAAPAKKAKVEEEAEAEEEEAEEEEEADWKVGQRVSFKDENGKKVIGKVTEVQDGVCVVDVKGDEWEIDFEDLTAL